jgi:uncharacterized membrane protein (DUF373 family)
VATDTDQDQPGVEPIDRILGTAENLVYAAAGALLVVSAVVVLGAVAYHLATDLSKGAEKAVTTALDGLLVVFIVLELLAGVRATMVERKLVAEPFLVVGIIASIKEIIVIALDTSTSKGLDDPAFQASMTEMGVLGLLIVLLAVAGYLVRRKEREPTEGEGR